jgi:hypothetical protein
MFLVVSHESHIEFPTHGMKTSLDHFSQGFCQETHRPWRLTALALFGGAKDHRTVSWAALDPWKFMESLNP